MSGLGHSDGYRKFRVNRGSSDIETDDIFLDALAHKKDRGAYSMETALSQKIFHLVLATFFIVLSIFLYYCFSFQIIDYKSYAEQAEKNKFLSSEVDAQRGIIYDRNFKQLVSNTQTFDLVCNIYNLPKDEYEQEKQLREVSRVMNIPYDDLKNNIAEMKKAGEIKFDIARDLDKEKVIVLKTKEEELTGFSIVKKKKREYIKNNIYYEKFTRELIEDEKRRKIKHYKDQKIVNRHGQGADILKAAGVIRVHWFYSYIESYGTLDEPYRDDAFINYGEYHREINQNQHGAINPGKPRRHSEPGVLPEEKNVQADNGRADKRKILNERLVVDPVEFLQEAFI